MSDTIRYEKRGGVATIVLADPPANTYSYAMMREIDAAVLDARMDADVHAIVLRGDGEKFFCAGADIKMLREADPGFKYAFCLHANETLNRLEQTPKLVVAALNGHCVGGGLEVALAADLRVAKKDGGKIGLPEVNLGVLPGTGGTQRLARAIGRARAFELMATGRTFSFEEARELGLVHEIFDADGFDASVRDYVARFLPPGRASRAVGLIKRAVVSGLEAGFHEGLALERELQQRLFESDDAREGLEAYLERRAARFSGR
ncbi:MAG TPA: enoyl-CoA hydratase/isomerase family protein [Candidatus Polarisedimenticolaceae bacterium]|nr:enoyl-CoA hydratase/isomerase family protein [Candidatus Polarisedimenticolaceae bacterium]